MKLSIETQVGTAVAAAFIAMTAIAIAQGDSQGRTGLPDAYGPRNNPRINTEINAEVNTEVTGKGYSSGLQPTLWVDAIRL